MKQFKIFYMKPSFFADGILGPHWLEHNQKLPTVKKLDETHVYLRCIEADTMKEVFAKMQAEMWSPNGEAIDLIEEKGLHHTSMSVGDVIVDEEGRVFMIESMGFWELK